MSAPTYAQLIRLMHAAKKLRLNQHRYSRVQAEEFRQLAIDGGRVVDDILREIGEQVHAAPTEQPMLFPPPTSGRRQA